MRKLENPSCQQLLDEFNDTEGRPLREHVGTATPTEYLFSRRVAERCGS